MVAFARLTRSLIAVSATLLAAGTTAQDNNQLGVRPNANWTGTIAEIDGGHRIGNPEAEAKLIEFMSYTCSHCADFARTGEGAIKLLYVPSGKVSFEIRHLIRDPVDLTVALAAQCGETRDFPGNHEALILKHPEWMGKARIMTQAQLARWQFGRFPARAQAIASDLGFYEIMERRGYSRSDLDRCLTDEAKARAIADQSQADIERYGLRGTPTFFLNGKQLDEHDWSSLQPRLDEFFR